MPSDLDIRDALRQAGHLGGDRGDLPTSSKRFPDGSRYRVEIPSVEGPEVLLAALEEADARGVLLHRVSQGSGVSMPTDGELDELADIGAARKVEVSLFARPNAGWHLSASARVAAGAYLAPAARGQEQVVQALEEAARAAAHGIRSVLIADVGTLAAFRDLRAAGFLPKDMQAKVSVSLPVTNASTAHLLEELGANSLNLAPDLDLAQIAAIRAAVDVPVDVYIEAPDSLGGIFRMNEIAEIVRVAAPVFVKFGLRNAPDIYPSGRHVRALALDLTRERVRRAQLGLEAIHRAFPDEPVSEPGSAGLMCPVLGRSVHAVEIDHRPLMKPSP
jgi:Peptidase family U32